MYGAFKPDTLNWESKYAIENIRMTGFIAQDVEQATKETGYDFSGLVKPTSENDLYSLRYSEFVVPLVKATQELSEQNNSLQKMVDNQQRQIDGLVKEIELLKRKIK